MHLPVAAAVVVAAAVLRTSVEEWCLLVLCIAGVLAAELFNTAIERLARAVTREHHPDLRDALDIASAGVLLAASGAAVVGVLVLGAEWAALLGWW